MAEVTTPTDEKIASEVKIEDVGPAAKRLTITVSPDAISQKLESSLGSLVADTALPGFRKGRAPRKLLERRFGDALRTETKNQIVAAAYADAIDQHQIKPVGEPTPVGSLEELELHEGQPLTFSVDVEVVPDFELPALDGVEIKKPVLDITQEMVDAELLRYRTQLGEATTIDGDFIEDDRLIGSAVVTRGGEEEPFFTNDQVVIVYPGTQDGGRGQVLGLLIDGLAELLAGKRVTDSVTIKTVGPEGHEREDIRGAELVIEFTINQARRIHPATVEEVIGTLGLGTEEILMEQIKLALEHRRDEEQAAALRRQLSDYLLSVVDFELPKKLSERQVARTLERYRFEMLYQGMSVEEIEDKLAEVRAESEITTRNRLKLFFILQRLANHYGIDVSQQEINGRVASIAASRNSRPEKLMQELVQSGQINEVTTQIRENKALDRMAQHAKVTEISAEEWRKLMSEKTASSGRTTKKTKTRRRRRIRRRPESLRKATPELRLRPRRRRRRRKPPARNSLRGAED